MEAGQGEAVQGTPHRVRNDEAGIASIVHFFLIMMLHAEEDRATRELVVRMPWQLYYWRTPTHC
jgi:hypothetical protein